jgi:hypothetical protein
MERNGMTWQAVSTKHSDMSNHKKRKFTTNHTGPLARKPHEQEREFRMKNPAAERRGIFVREEKVLRTFLILYWGSATPPSLAKD